MSIKPEISYSPAQIAEAIGQYRPNPDQEKVICAPVDKPMMAIAGAGAGKTATMAFRVVYLVANALVSAERVLGLTFSNKADRELSERVNNYLRQLAKHKDFSKVAEFLTDSETGALMRPVTSTYNAFANQIVRQYGSRLGVSPACVLLDEARRWQLMYQVVSEWAGDLTTELGVGATVKNALALGSQLRDQLIESEDVRAGLTQMKQLYSSGRPGKRSNKPNKNMQTFLDSLTYRGELLDIFAEYEKLKKQNGYLEYSDQIYYAALLVEKFDDIREQIRSRYDVILLDEFQDTSVAQLKLFSTIFSGKGVMAVGDPNQGIYDWRGASDLSMQHFLSSFGVPASEHAAHIQDMPVTYRNREAILEVANQVVLPLRNLSAGKSASQVEDEVRSRLAGPEPEYKLDPAPSPDQFAAPSLGVKAKELVTCPQKRDNPGEVQMYFVEDSQQEAELVADFFAECWAEREQIIAKNQQLPSHEQQSVPTGAILIRKHSQGPLLTQALRKRKLPVEVSGVAGLIYDPAVADVIAALQVSADAGRGDALMRLITGCGISPADIDLLWRWAGHLANPEGEQDKRVQPYLMDALDNLPQPGWSVKGTGSAFSSEAYRRLDILRSQLATLRRHLHDSLGSLVQRTIFTLCLDLDVKVRPDGGVSARCLESFVKVARDYQASGVNADLPGFLEWLKFADQQGSGLDMPLQEPDPNAIQLMTIHAAKGLEWTWVAVPGMDESRSGSGSLPKTAISVNKGECKDSAWISDKGMIPYDLRPDKQVLPTIERGIENSGYDFAEGAFSDNPKVITSYQYALGFHSQLADRRLAYVAFTRAESKLLIGGSAHSATAKKERVPSQFLAEVDSSGKLRELRNRQADENDSWEAPAREESWPGAVSPQLSRLSVAAGELSELISGIHAHPFLHRLVSTSDLEEAQDMADSHSSWLSQAVQLTRDLRVEQEYLGQVQMPVSSGVTRARELQANPAAFALNQRRPLPDFPTAGARVGTLFHQWVDQQQRGNDYPLPDNLDSQVREDLCSLQHSWRQAKIHPEDGWEYIDSEVEFSAPMAIKLVARIDAILRNPVTGKPTIIDWKTDSLQFNKSGAISDKAGELVAKYMQQINTYRLVYAFSKGMRLDEVDAALFFVRHQLLLPLEEWRAKLNLPQKLEELFPDLV